MKNNMKTIGLIGGMSWESTQLYYRIINKTIRKKLGKHHSAKILIYSFDFEEILEYQNDWIQITEKITDKAQKLEKAGADFILICANTMHKTFDDVQKAITIPIIHIADVTARKILKKGFKTVGLLGTKLTMEEDFYKKRLKEKFDIDVLIPSEDERNLVHKIIYKELVAGKIKKYSKHMYYSIMYELIEQGAEGIILGCTEIPLLIKQKDIRIPVFNTTRIHAEAAVNFALKNEKRLK